jgi:hypothetical protein
MATCPLCSVRSAKRYCPAKDVQICPVCCGTKREIEIDCPSSCAHLKASRSYELDKPVLDAETIAKIQKYDQTFIEQYQPILNAVNQAVLEERFASPWLVDQDVIEVYKALTATMRTLSSGIYYESVPESPIRASLFRRLKTLFDRIMTPDGAPDHRTLKVSEATDIGEFLTLAAQVNSSIRPRSRRYLDWIADTFGYAQPQQTSSLIVP